MARSLAISRWGRSRLARRMIWMRSLALGLVSWRKACSRDWDSASGSRMRITFGQSSLSFLLSLYAPDTFTGYVYQGRRRPGHFDGVATPDPAAGPWSATARRTTPRVREPGVC